MAGTSIWAAADPSGRLLRQPVQLLRLSGPDTLRFLHGQSSQDLALARPGAWLATCCITPTARMRALAEVLVEEQGALLVITAGDGAAVRQAFDRVLFPADAVALGPLEEGLWLEPLGDEGAANGPADRWLEESGGGWRLGRALVLPAGQALPPELEALAPLEPWTLEFRRLRLGLPAAPAELNDETNPFELGLAGRVSLSKGCYVGQETLARLATYDGVKQQLRRWHAPLPPAAGGLAAGLEAPQPGMTLISAAGERAGVISSCLALPDGAGWVGLALVRRAALREEQLFCGAAGDPGVAEEAPEANTRLGLEISVPELFQPPPQGAGGQGAAPAVSRGGGA